MKKVISILLVIAVLLMVSGCASEEKKNYEAAESLAAEGAFEEAIEKISAYPDYEDSAEKTLEYKYSWARRLLKLDEQVNAVDQFGLYPDLSGDALGKALELLTELGDYKDAASVKEQVENRLVYDEYHGAVKAFEAGNFDEALPVFEKLGADYEQTQRYLTAIDRLKLHIGNWALEDGYLSAQDNKRDVWTDIKLEIKAPFRLGESNNWSDCDWAVYADVTMNVEKIVPGGGGSRFSIRGEKELFAHTENSPDTELSTLEMIRNESGETVFGHNYYLYSKLYLRYYSDGSKILISETPYDVNWTSYYSDTGDAVLVMDD